LDVLLSNGFVGFFVFVFFLSYLILKSVRNKNGVLFGIIIVFSLACLTENVLGRNQGIVLISFLISITLLKREGLNLESKD
jgi:hypothetical protein